MKAIEEAIVRLKTQRDALTSEIRGMETALKIAKGEPLGDEKDLRVPSVERHRRGNVKTTVLDIVAEAADRGITVNECVTVADVDRGINLDRGSVSSLLSRLKKDDVLFYDGDRYRLKKYAGPKAA